MRPGRRRGDQVSLPPCQLSSLLRRLPLWVPLPYGVGPKDVRAEVQHSGTAVFGLDLESPVILHPLRRYVDWVCSRHVRGRNHVRSRETAADDLAGLDVVQVVACRPASQHGREDQKPDRDSEHHPDAVLVVVVGAEEEVVEAVSRSTEGGESSQHNYQALHKHRPGRVKNNSTLKVMLYIIT